MGLTKHYVDIKDVKFADRDYIKDHVLYLNREAMIERLNDRLFKSLELELAFPGDKTRITTPGDIIQPMIKLENEKATFPGSLGEMKRAGTGASLMLRGLAVTESYETQTTNCTFIDMWGEAAEHTIFSQIIHIVIVARPQDGADLRSYIDALNKAGLTLAKYLASLAKEVKPDEIKTFSLPKGDYKGKDGKPLPRVAYVMYDMHLANLQTALLYGHEALEAFPTILEPFEILDGALVCINHDQIINSSPTYSYQNHPIIEELIARHGKDLYFAGLVVASVNFALINKARNAMIAENLCKNVLEADIVLITKESGGHPQIDCSTLCDLCEEDGIQVAMLQSEFSANSFGSEEGLLFNSPHAKSIVTPGCLYNMSLEKPDKVIGYKRDWVPYHMTPLDGPVMALNWRLRGGLCQIGESMYSSFKF